MFIDNGTGNIFMEQQAAISSDIVLRFNAPALQLRHTLLVPYMVLKAEVYRSVRRSDEGCKSW